MCCKIYSKIIQNGKIYPQLCFCVGYFGSDQKFKLKCIMGTPEYNGVPHLRTIQRFLPGKPSGNVKRTELCTDQEKPTKN